MRTSYTSIGYALVTLACLGGSGCEGDLSRQLATPEVPEQGGHIKTTGEPGGSLFSRVDASSMTSWIYLRLASGDEVTPPDPQSSADWDLGLQRFQLKVNGGVSGKAGVAVALVVGTPFDSITVAPSSGYVTDEPPAGTDPEPRYAFTQRGTWYDYDQNTHILTPKEQVYVVHATTGAYYKLQLTGYYDAAGSSGYPTLRWQSLMSP